MIMTVVSIFRSFMEVIIFNILLYVDDMLIASKSKVETDRLKFQLGKDFETKNSGAANKILGMEIRRDRSNRKLFLSQKGYIERG